MQPMLGKMSENQYDDARECLFCLNCVNSKTFDMHFNVAHQSNGMKRATKKNSNAI